MRVVLPLLRASITSIDSSGFTIAIGAHYGSPTSIRVSCQTEMYDLRDGDQVTIYTEVLLKPAKGTS